MKYGEWQYDPGGDSGTNNTGIEPFAHVTERVH